MLEVETHYFTDIYAVLAYSLKEIICKICSAFEDFFNVTFNGVGFALSILELIPSPQAFVLGIN